MAVTSVLGLGTWNQSLESNSLIDDKNSEFDFSIRVLFEDFFARIHRRKVHKYSTEKGANEKMKNNLEISEKILMLRL